MRSLMYCLAWVLLFSTVFFVNNLWFQANITSSESELLIQLAGTEASNWSSRCCTLDSVPIVTHSLFKAGTGNTMFFIASVIGIARTNNRQPALSKTIPLQNIMNINLPVMDPSALKSFKRIQDSSVGIYHKNYQNLTALVGSSNVYFAGYLQSYKYFHKLKTELQHHFRFIDQVIREAETVIEHTTEGMSIKPTLVGIHVRRGDFLKNSATRALHRTAPKEYFIKVMASLRSRLQSPLLFLVVSDSLDWCRTTFSRYTDVRLVNGTSSAAVDMKILQSMEYLILSVGTFGWWSGYLSSAKSVTYYRHWYHADTDTGRKFRPNDFFPPEWNSAD